MNAGDVKEALRRRWPCQEYVVMEEVSLDPTRMYATADLVAISCWASRHYEIDAVEVKVSYSDWKRELEKPAKSQLWVLHSNRWWVAAPAKLAERIRPELPDGWGLLSVVSSVYAEVVVKAAKRDRAEPSWPMVVGLLRSAQNAGIAAIERAEQRGYQRGLSVEVQQALAGEDPWLSRRRVPNR